MVSHKNWQKPEKGKQSWSGPFRAKMKPSKKDEEPAMENEYEPGDEDETHAG